LATLGYWQILLNVLRVFLEDVVGVVPFWIVERVGLTIFLPLPLLGSIMVPCHFGTMQFQSRQEKVQTLVVSIAFFIFVLTVRCVRSMRCARIVDWLLDPLSRQTILLVAPLIGVASQYCPSTAWKESKCSPSGCGS
jgi:hypothetical protein